MNICAKDSLFYCKYVCFSISYINFLPYIFYSDAKIQIFWRENGRGHEFFGGKDLTLNKSKALGLIRCRRENMYWPLWFFPDKRAKGEIEKVAASRYINCHFVWLQKKFSVKSFKTPIFLSWCEKGFTLAWCCSKSWQKAIISVAN